VKRILFVDLRRVLKIRKEMERIERFFASYATMTVLLVLYATGLAAATFIEKAHGTALARALIYYSPLFFLLQLLLVVNFVAIAVKRRLLKSGRWGMLTVHFSFIVILAGALVSHVFGQEGVLHLREGMKSDQMEMQTGRGHAVHRLPFGMELVKFTLTRYPGSMSPSSYESELLVYAGGETLRRRVSMNNVLDIQGYRFFQASFDSDERGTVLSVNRDVAGRNVTYAGYLLLAAGLLLCLTGRKGRIRSLYRQLKSAGTPVRMFLIAAVAGLWPGTGVRAESSPMLEAVQRHAVPEAHARRFGALPIQALNGRMIPVNTFSSEILRKLHRKTRIGTLDADRFLLSLLVMPAMWERVPFIAYSNGEIGGRYGLSPGACAFVEVFDDGGSYKLQEGVDAAYRKMPAERSRFDKDLIRLDEQINVFYQLTRCERLNLFPKADDAEGKWYAPGDDLSGFSGQDSLFVARIFTWYLSEVQEALTSGEWGGADEVLDMIAAYQEKRNNVEGWSREKIDRELKYNRMEYFRWSRVGYLSLGGLLLVFSFLLFFRQRKWLRVVIRVLTVGVLLVFHFHMLGMALRWQIGEHAPWSNSYETMVYVAWATVCAGLLFARRSPLTMALATLFAGIILFVSGLSWMDPQINPLVPVLKSPWLMFHVAILMAAYGFFGISFLLGVTSLGMMSAIRKAKLPAYARSLRELSLINEMSLLAGLVLMTAGTFMGAVWANESWGRYWGWDPKETWALITIIVYVLVTHVRLLPKCNSMWMLNLCSVIAFASVLMTYFGVNFFLSGMHSYGQNDAIHGVSTALYAAAALVILLAVLARKGRSLTGNVPTNGEWRIES
jgi:cytochrome c-type biogenesis protein CcsB